MPDMQQEIAALWAKIDDIERGNHVAGTVISSDSTAATVTMQIVGADGTPQNVTFPVAGNFVPEPGSTAVVTVNGQSPLVLPLNGQTVAVDGAWIRSPNYVAGVSGWKIDADGSAEFSNVFIRGTLTAGVIVGDSTNQKTLNPGAETAASGAELMANGTFDVNINGWMAITNAPTLARITAAPTPADGAGALSITATAASSWAVSSPIGTSGFAVTPGTSYLVSAKIRTAVTVRNISIDLRQYGSDGTDLFHSDQVGAVNDASGSWTTVSKLMTVHDPRAAFGAIRVSSASSVAIGEVHYVDTVTVIENLPGWGNDSYVLANLSAQAIQSLSRSTSSPIVGAASALATASGSATAVLPEVVSFGYIPVTEDYQGYECSVAMKTTAGLCKLLFGVAWFSSAGGFLYEDHANAWVQADTTAKTYKFATMAAPGVAYGLFGVGLGTASAAVRLDTVSILKVPSIINAYVAADYVVSQTDVIDATGYLMPVGGIIPWAGSFSTTGGVYAQGGVGGGSEDTGIAGWPAGWAPCDGRAVSRTDFWRLYSVIGTTYGTGDGSTTYNLPDLRGRVPVALDNLGGSDAGRLAAANTLGGVGGHENLQAHSHTLSAHVHQLSGNQFWANVAGLDSTLAAGTVAASGITNSFGPSPDTTSRVGAGNAENMPPYMLVNYLIKVSTKENQW